MEKLCRSSSLVVMKYRLPNGKQVLQLVTDQRTRSYQRWPGQPWEPIDPQIFRFTHLRGVAVEVRTV